MQKKKAMAAILLISIILSACAFTIKTWVIQDGILIHGKERLDAFKAQGYRCYSEADDTLWRTQLKIERACCAGK